MATGVFGNWLLHGLTSLPGDDCCCWWSDAADELKQIKRLNHDLLTGTLAPNDCGKGTGQLRWNVSYFPLDVPQAFPPLWLLLFSPYNPNCLLLTY